MSNKIVFNFEEKHHILVVDGKEYEIPYRTAEREKLIKERDLKRLALGEYESYKSLLNIFFGEDKTNEMFPEDEKTVNLDKMARVCEYAIAAYYSEYENIKSERAEKQMKSVKPIIDATEKIAKMQTKKFISGKKK